MPWRGGRHWVRVALAAGLIAYFVITRGGYDRPPEVVREDVGHEERKHSVPVLSGVCGDMR